MGPRGRLAGTVALTTAWVLGTAAAALVAVLLWDGAALCPDWESEGPTAAPGSPYAVVMCEPFEVPLRWSVLGVVLVSWLALLLLAVAWRRRGGRARLAASVLALVVVPPLLQLVQHELLPRDCLSGREEQGPCARDRERTSPR